MQKVNGRRNLKTKSPQKYHLNDNGLTIVYFGNGKGKTTAALGAVLRATGEGWKCAVYQFIKGPWPSAERESIKKYLPKLATIETGGKGFVGIMGDKLPKDAHQKSARALFERAISNFQLPPLRSTNSTGQAISNKISNTKSLFLLVLDELLDAVELGFIKESEVVMFIKNKPKNVHLIITGHKKYSKIFAAADLVTEMKKIKHPFDKGFLAIKGLDY
jgi:cob(I)alamin adenosyltransferase